VIHGAIEIRVTETLWSKKNRADFVSWCITSSTPPNKHDLQQNEKRLDTQNLVDDHYNEISLRNSDYLKSDAYNLCTLQTAAVNHVSKIAGNYFGVL
jgi:hypothetical protein